MEFDHHGSLLAVADSNRAIGVFDFDEVNTRTSIGFIKNMTSTGGINLH